MDWHQRIFPAISIVIVGLAILFIGTSLYHFSQISAYLQQSPDVDVEPILARALGTDKARLDEGFETGSYIPHWAGLLTLEAASMKKRHHQANALLASRLWLRYLAVVSGIVLVCVGSIFTLAKLQEGATHVEGEASTIKLRVASASPGLIMTMLGCALILTAVLHNPAITLQDGRSYLGNEHTPLPGVSQ